WPANGGAEDPVIGSIHAALAPLWAQTLGKAQLTALQASAVAVAVAVAVHDARRAQAHDAQHRRNSHNLPG
ncbi:hypothetical protein VWT71_21750, partial [Xanthomonas citri pv. citri]